MKTSTRIWIGLVLLAVILVYVYTPGKNTEESSLENHPNLILIGDEFETNYVHPSQFYEFVARKIASGHSGSASVMQSQVSSFLYKGQEFAVSAPHVIQTPAPMWHHPVPAMSGIGVWKNSDDGREISFAKITDREKAGFLAPSKECVKATIHTPTIILGVKIDNCVATKIEIMGYLEKVDDEETINQLGGKMVQGSSMGERLLKRAPTKSILVMPIEARLAHLLPGLSGAIAWQNEKPVGVFGAMVYITDEIILALIEPILESVQSTKL